MRPVAPYGRIRTRVSLSAGLLEELPRTWEKLGDLILLRFPEELRPYQEEVCRAYAEVLGAASVLDVSDGISGPLRRPRTELLWGSRTTTFHKENGVLFKLDPQKVMFSSGNVDERIRMSRICLPGEVVVDLFAGIGYFSVPMAFHGNPERVYACEVNPEAYALLLENVRRNEVPQVSPLLGDCMQVAPEGVADRVVMGYLKSTHRFLPKAIRSLRQGGWVHYHEGCPDARVDRLTGHVEAAAEREGMVVEEWRRRRIKSYAPGVSHWVLDVRVSPG